MVIAFTSTPEACVLPTHSTGTKMMAGFFVKPLHVMVWCYEDPLVIIRVHLDSTDLVGTKEPVFVLSHKTWKRN